MSIDGRRAQAAAEDQDLYQSTSVRLAGALLIGVPVLLLLCFMYWTGTWFGGVAGGVSSLLSTAVTVGVLWLMKRRRR